MLLITALDVLLWPADWVQLYLLSNLPLVPLEMPLLSYTTSQFITSVLLLSLSKLLTSSIKITLKCKRKRNYDISGELVSRISKQTKSSNNMGVWEKPIVSYRSWFKEPNDKFNWLLFELNLLHSNCFYMLFSIQFNWVMCVKLIGSKCSINGTVY